MDTLGTCELRCLATGCGTVIKINDSVEMTPKGWMHKRCAYRELPALMVEAPVVLERPADSVEPQGILDEVAATISRMLDVPRMDGDTEAEWRSRRGAGIAHVLGAHFRIERRA
jgi:hypothetical protein